MLVVEPYGNSRDYGKNDGPAEKNSEAILLPEKLSFKASGVVNPLSAGGWSLLEAMISSLRLPLGPLQRARC